MANYLYLSITPEALIASMLAPEEFGNYFAVGTKKRTRGQAMFFELDIDKMPDDFPKNEIENKCVPHADNTPKRSVYLSIYRALEYVPLKAIKNLFLVTDDGRVLSLEQDEYKEEDGNSLHLYQELCPVTPRIATRYNPSNFMKYVTNTSQPVSVPKLFFVELKLDELAVDPLKGNVNDLPYPNIDHLRDCLIGIQEKPAKATKTVIRTFYGELNFRTCKNGFFIGDKENILYYPFPSFEELNTKYYVWWRSALTIGLR
ncbi:MAG: hypothetical protein JW995_07845 [Melioribacteraceae bacterium]|nr:hypothetical protein [Melioribacteraceae bacterium]